MPTMKKSVGGVFGNVTKEPPNQNEPGSIFGGGSSKMKPISGLFGQNADKDENKQSSPSKKDNSNKNSSPIGFLAGSNESAVLFGNAKTPALAPKDETKGASLFGNS